ncbi:porin, partial [Paraburkholderia aspalathi]|uniref:porin n=1 Tax=Paraburkholderia aspalathi TaxID=1324617 RepID=UPI0038BABB4B
MKKQWITAPVVLSFAGIAAAQSSVELYGIVDAGITYRSNERTGSPGSDTGHSNVAVTSGNLSGSRWGFKGQEQLGADWFALFVLEDGFDVTSGKIQQNGGLFGRQAFVGIGSQQYGTVTLGRQYTSLNDFVAPISPVAFVGGYGAHPGDIDDLDQTARVNN